MEKQSLEVLCISRLDYGGTDYRVGLWQLAAEIARQRKVKYVVLFGGLVDGRSLEAKLKELLKGARGNQRDAVRKEFLTKAATFLKENLPVIEGVKMYIITSPAYDGKVGEEVARLLAEMRRDDIRLYHTADRLELKQIGKMLGVYVPKQGVWMRGKYYDTLVLRVLTDEKQRSTRGIGDINGVGCGGSALFQTGDSSDVGKPYFSVPALCKIGENKTGVDNQVGALVLDFGSSNPKETTINVYSFKDLLSDEWLFVDSPDGISESAKKVADVLRKDGPKSIGSLSDAVGLGRDIVLEAVNQLMQKPATASWSGVILDKEDQRYYLNLEWFRDRMRYKLPKEEKVDSVIAWGCMHAACDNSDMEFMRSVLPELALRHNADTFIGVGDFIEGLKHDLMLLGEIVTGSQHVMNYSKQEKLAAFLVGSAMFKVFKVRFEALMKENGRTKVGEKRLTDFVNRSLIKFVYIAGNHCGWVGPLGFDPLGTFRSELRHFLFYNIAKYLEDKDLCVYNLGLIVQEKLVELKQCELHQANSGLQMALLHPSMSRTKTISIRPQEMLQKAKDAKLVFGANFHVSELVHHWEIEHGQRVCLQLGTLKVKSGFEETKLKTVDFGVGCLKVFSNGVRIVRTETTYACTPSANVREGNRKVLKDYDKWLEVNK